MALPYELGEMKTETGEVLRYEVEAAASDLALRIEELLREYPLYRQIVERTGSSKVSLYFQKAIKSEIYPVVRDIRVLYWKRRNSLEASQNEDVLCIPSKGIFLFLEKVCFDETVSLRFVSPSLRKRFHSFYWALRSLARKSIDRFWAIYCRCRYKKAFRGPSADKSVIAVQFVEGLDLQRRADIVWYLPSGIDPKRVLIYFDWPDSYPVDNHIINEIRALGVQWVCLKRRVLINKNNPVWSPPLSGKKRVTDLDIKPQGEIEKWIYRKGKELLEEINYWSDFYDAFNIKANFIIGGGAPGYVARSIAFDLHGSKDGYLVTKQRSELHWPSLSILGNYPVDVFFTWSPRSEQYLLPNANQIIASISTGYPNDFVFKHKQLETKTLKDLLRSQGANYIVALFDNSHGPDIAHSSTNMEQFYLAFLNWLLEDPGFGIVIKSKKPSVLQRLPRVQPILEKAVATGRCIRLGDEFGRLPVDASLASDMVVGIGISSAVIESAIAGCRGIHCDLTNFHSHEFYQWGYERIIFDDLDRLITAIKSDKSDRATCPELGDWTPFLDRLDPFRDGRAGERMGDYLRWCLEGFDEGLNRDEVIRRASEKYKGQWGRDKAVML